VLPPLDGVVTACRLSPDDALFLVRALPRLPGQGDDHEPVTVELNGQLVVRARGEGQERSTELVLTHSEVTGPPVRFVTNRGYLARAAQLGSPELHPGQPGAPVVCRDARRTSLWVPRSPDGALPPGEGALRIYSTGEASPAPPPPGERRRAPV